MLPGGGVEPGETLGRRCGASSARSSDSRTTSPSRGRSPSPTRSRPHWRPGDRHVIQIVFGCDLSDRSLEHVESGDAAVRGLRLFGVDEIEEIVLHPPIKRFVQRWRPGDPAVYLGSLWVVSEAGAGLAGGRPDSLRSSKRSREAQVKVVHCPCGHERRRRDRRRARRERPGASRLGPPRARRRVLDRADPGDGTRALSGCREGSVCQAPLPAGRCRYASGPIFARRRRLPVRRLRWLSARPAATAWAARSSPSSSGSSSTGRPRRCSSASASSRSANHGLRGSSGPCR